MVAAALVHPLVRSGLQKLLPPSGPGPGPVPAHIVYPRYIDCYYGLNRFLTLLISEYILKEFHYQTLFPGWSIETISPVDRTSHNCTVMKGGQEHASGTYIGGVLIKHDCFEHPHHVTLQSSTGRKTDDYNVIIVRHGIKPHASAPQLSRSRHLLPYHRP